VNDGEDLAQLPGVGENDQRCGGRLKWTDEEPGRQAVYFKDPETGGLTRFFVSLVSLLPIEGQL